MLQEWQRALSGLRHCGRDSRSLLHSPYNVDLNYIMNYDFLSLCTQSVCLFCFIFNWNEKSICVSSKPLRNLFTQKGGIALERLHKRLNIHTHPQLGFLSRKHFFALFWLLLFMKATVSVLMPRLYYESSRKQINVEHTLSKNTHLQQYRDFFWLERSAGLLILQRLHISIPLFPA